MDEMRRRMITARRIAFENVDRRRQLIADAKHAYAFRVAVYERAR